MASHEKVQGYDYVYKGDETESSASDASVMFNVPNAPSDINKLDKESLMAILLENCRNEAAQP